jgi:hypothetical protein
MKELVAGFLILGGILAFVFGSIIVYTFWPLPDEYFDEQKPSDIV